MDEPVVVEFQLTPEEWVEVSLQHSAQQPQIVRATRSVRRSFVLITVLLAVLFFMNGLAGAGYVFLIASIVGTAVLGPLIRSSQRKRTLEYARSGIQNGMFGPHRVELRPEGMLDCTEGYEWLTRWSAIDRVEEGEGAFLVYTGPNALLPIPHSAFPDSESLRRFSHAFFAFRKAAETGRLQAGGLDGAAPSEGARAPSEEPPGASGDAQPTAGQPEREPPRPL